MPEDGSVSMEIDTGSDYQQFLLYDCFVGSENGKNYVMAVNSDNKIEKRYVTVSGTLFEFVAVKGGLESTDRIALAYGKVQEGMKTVEVDGETLIWGPMFF